MKMSYCRHRRFLRSHHSFRKQKKAFNALQEFRETLLPMTGEHILRKLDAMKFDHGNKCKRTAADICAWKKINIL